MTDCKHEHLVHCPVCETVRCADCGRVWTFEQDRETTPMRPTWPTWPYWPTYTPQPWEPQIYGVERTDAPPPPTDIIITCDGANSTGTVVSERDNVTITCGATA